MNGTNVLDAMNYIDPDLISEVDTLAKPRHVDIGLFSDQIRLVTTRALHEDGGPRFRFRWLYLAVVVIVICAVGMWVVSTGIIDGGRDEKAAFTAMQEDHNEVISIQKMTKTAISVQEAWDMAEGNIEDTYESEDIQSAELISIICQTESGTIPDPLVYLAIKINGKWIALEIKN